MSIYSGFFRLGGVDSHGARPKCRLNKWRGLDHGFDAIGSERGENKDGSIPF